MGQNGNSQYNGKTGKFSDSEDFKVSTAFQEGMFSGIAVNQLEC